MTNFKKSQKITMVSLIGVGLFNPMTVEVLEEYFKLVYMGISVACMGWLVVYVLFTAFKPEANKVPKKNKARTVKMKEYLS